MWGDLGGARLVGRLLAIRKEGFILLSPKG